MEIILIFSISANVVLFYTLFQRTYYTSSEKALCYGDKVVVTSGFYKGQKGVVVYKRDDDSYVLKSNYGALAGSHWKFEELKKVN